MSRARVPCAQDVGPVLKESPNKDWDNIVQRCRTSEQANETLWALQQIEHVLHRA